MLILRCELGMQMKMKEYSACKSETQTGHVVGVVSIPMASKGTNYGHWRTGWRPKREEGLKPFSIKDQEEEGEEPAKKSENEGTETGRKQESAVSQIQVRDRGLIIKCQWEFGWKEHWPYDLATWKSQVTLMGRGLVER